VIDLHLHTTASDGLLTPEQLVARAAAAGLTIISVTDHDTVAGLSQARPAAAQLGVRLVAGIEITAVELGRDVHVLGYFIDPASDTLTAFLRDQRIARQQRVRDIGDRLESLGYAVDVDALLAHAQTRDGSIGRPAIADALVSAGHALDRNDAFARFLGRDKPAFVARQGVCGAEVIAAIHEAGGIASLAHPVLLCDDALVPVLAAAGLDALEVWHSDHSPEDRSRYRDLAERLGLARSGGSDFHGDGVHRACELGAIALPPEEFATLESRAARP